MDAVTGRQGQGRVWRGLAMVIGSLLLCACGSRSADSVPLHVEIDHVIGAQPLQLGAAEVALPNGEHLRVERLRYYLSNFRLRRHDGSWSAADRSDADSRGYFLIDEAEPASRRFDVAGFAPGEYEGLEFLIGVDAARNAAGVQTGTLDPARGLFWTWNSGYVFFKLEGHSPESSDATQSVAYHIGGSREPHNNARSVYLPLGSKPARLSDTLSATVHLVADLGQLFAADGGLRIAERATVMEPADGAPAADRIAGLFRVDHLHLEPRH